VDAALVALIRRVDFCARSDCSRFGGRGFDGWILLKAMRSLLLT